MRIVIGLLLACLCTTLYAAPPAHIEAQYDVITRGVKIATISEKFTRSGNRYRIESYTKPVGLLAMFKPDTILAVSEGEITARGLQPRRFTYQRSVDTDRNTEAGFDWTQSSLMLNDRNGSRLVTLSADTQDRLSAQYQFRYIPQLAERANVTMHITNGSKVDTRQYVLHGRQTLSLPLGSLETLYLSTPPEATAWKTELWLSPENGNFPCKIAVTEDNGDQLIQVLTALSITQ